MLVEIPDPEVLLGIVLAFLGGLGALYVFYKIKSLTSRPSGVDPSYLERMEFYERQLIDMKIRMDSMNIDQMTYQTPLQKESAQEYEKPLEPKPHRIQKHVQVNTH